ncbi:hypothetical protein [Jiangella mangrovi]|uniref:Phosphate transport system substrate-binding protein n=1 Tax=Jiangella mangrovi TaxID=1524084 RepID=A0A7W9GVL7_9ACTN|nr:hypothetical protein [Jiangella mangrovi]MBB5790561.1 phosphate transport system substrate-binding protein [Jiangella mangrovi]
MKVNAFGKTAVFGLGAALLAIGAFAGPAQADPPPSGALAIAGSDTTQDVVNGLAGISGGLLESWHASVGGVTHDLIAPKSGTFTVTRPNGSSEGRDALRRSLGTNVATPWAGANSVPVGSDVFDAARSSSGPGSNQNNNGQLVYIPFALDAVTTATGPTSTLPSFTLAQLQTMYSTGAGVTVGGTTYTPDSNITLLIPQAGSGTRQFWADTMGINATTPPAWVHDTLGGVSVQEHDGTVLQTNPTAIVPFSIAQWIAQTNGVAPDRLHGAELGTINGVQPTVENPETEQQVLNPAFPVTREVYNIVSHAQATGGDALIMATFVGSSSTACNVSTIELFGFASIGSRCGSINTNLRAFPNG